MKTRFYLASDRLNHVLELVKTTGYIVQHYYVITFEDIRKYYDYA